MQHYLDSMLFYRISNNYNNENPEWQKEADEILAVSHQDHLSF